MQLNMSHVPIFVDDTKYAKEFNIVRLNYFYAESAEPQDTIYVKSDGAPTMMLIDLEGVIVSGVGGKEFLDTPDAIHQLFDYFDQETPYVISASYFWLPNGFLREQIGRDVSRGDVLRLYTQLFLRVCAGERTPTEFHLENIPADARAVYLSEQETAAFKAWTDMTVERVRTRYREQPERNLRYRARQAKGR